MNSSTLHAVVDCLIPADDFPGAYEGGVCDYLERLLQTDLANHAEIFRAGIQAIEAEALVRFDKPFANLSSAEQNATLAAIESGNVNTLWPAEAEEMLKAAQDHGCVHMIRHNYRRTPAVALARQLIKAGELGTIYHYRAT